MVFQLDVLKIKRFTTYLKGNFNTPYNESYGKLYNDYAVIDTRGLAPTGWHIPTGADWSKLEDYLENKYGSEYKVHLKNNTLWPSEIDDYGKKTNMNGTNNSGFSAVPGGYVNYDGEFSFGPGTKAFSNAGILWWSCTTGTFNGDRMFYSWELVNSYYYNFNHTLSYLFDGAYVRCVKD
ncbi:MAG: FISUMP domain-containing protein [Flavobacteriia bacterium]|jgi:uncharacterized protein (TIGR02145 family)